MSEKISVRMVVPLVAFLIAATAMALILFRSGGGQLPGRDTYQFQAVVPTAVALVPGAQVRMAGVEVGRVAEIKSRAGTAVLRLELDRDQGPVYRDARTDVRLKSLIGENYVSLDAGTPNAGALPMGGVLPLKNADEAVQLDQILSVLDKTSRQDLRDVLDGLGDGLRDGGSDLNDLGAGLSAAVDEAAPVVEVLDRQRRQVATLVDDLGAVTRAVGERGVALKTLAQREKVTAEAIAARDNALSDALDVLPSTLRQMRSTSAGLSELSVRATPVVNNLARSMDRLHPPINNLQQTAQRTRETVDALSDFAVAGRPLLKTLNRFSGTTQATLPPLDGVLGELNPVLKYLAPYSKEVSVFFGNLGSATATTDVTGNLARVMAGVNESSLMIRTPEHDALIDALFKVGGLSKVRTQARNSYPAPGEMAAPKPFTGDYPRLEALPRVLP